MKLNVACGEDLREGYFNCDLRCGDVRCDARALPFGDATFDSVLAQDVLEHFPRAQTQAVLAEWRRVLRPDGELVLRVPNMQVLAATIGLAIRKEAWETVQQVIENIYGGHRWGPEGAWDSHHTGWDPDLMYGELQTAGFANIDMTGDANFTASAIKR